MEVHHWQKFAGKKNKAKKEERQKKANGRAGGTGERTCACSSGCQVVTNAAHCSPTLSVAMLIPLHLYFTFLMRALARRRSLWQANLFLAATLFPRRCNVTLRQSVTRTGRLSRTGRHRGAQTLLCKQTGCGGASLLFHLPVRLCSIAQLTIHRSKLSFLELPAPVQARKPDFEARCSQATCPSSVL